ncbi:MAG: hypothetical protein EAX96_00720 [Candidatus Lokiarchaeota archaeon]|nr:hypothetical protein [Candidatus Lokiarchaeota archaeon]
MLDAFVNAHLSLIFSFILIALIFLFVNKYDQYKYRKNVSIYYIAYYSFITFGFFLYFMVYYSYDVVIKTMFFRMRYVVWALALFFGAGFSFNFLRENSFTIKSKKFYFISSLITFSIILSFYLNSGNDFASFSIENPISFIMVLTFYLTLSTVAVLIPFQFFRYSYINWKNRKNVYRPFSMAISFLIAVILVNIFAFLKLITLCTIGNFIGNLWIFYNFLNQSDLNIFVGETFEEFIETSDQNIAMHKQFELFNQKLSLKNQTLIEYSNINNKINIQKKIISDFLTLDKLILLFSPKGQSEKLIKKIEEEKSIKLIKYFEYSTTDQTIKKVKANGADVTILSIDLSILFESITISMEETLKRNEFLLIIFDSLTELINWHGFTKTYKFLKRLLDKFNEKEGITSIFILNEKSHDEKIKYSLRVIFDNILREI